MWHLEVGGTELYDARARVWSPALGSFLAVDEFAAHDPTTTLWGWPGQNPDRFSDPSGRNTANTWVGIFTQADRDSVFAQSAQLNWESGRDWDAGNHITAGLKLWASAGAFYNAAVPMRLLAKRRPTSADAAMMACPLEVPGMPLASDASAAAGLSAQLAAERTLAASGRIASADALGLGASRTALFDTATGTLHVGPAGPMSHAGLAESLGLPLDGGRYVGGFLNVSPQGGVVFDATSGTFPSGAADLPGNALDMVRGTGVTVRE
jgi:hypothetical protein